MSKTAAIILAAGRASRFRAQSPLPTKLTALWRGQPLVRHVAKAALASTARPVIVVTGFASADVAAALEGLAVELIHNAEFADGFAGSLKAGIAAVPEQCAGALVLLGDMPQVRASTLDAMIAVFTASAPLALVPLHDGQPGNPVLLGRALFGDIAGLDGDQGARKLLAAQNAGVMAWPCGDPGILADIDTPDALAKMQD